MSFDHRCDDPDCSYFGQRTFRGCKCHRTPDQMMATEIETLRARISELLQFNNEFEQRARDAERKLKEATIAANGLMKQIVDMLADQTAQQVCVACGDP